MAEVFLEVEGVGGRGDPGGKAEGGRTILSGRRADGSAYNFELHDQPENFGVHHHRGEWWVKTCLPGDARRAADQLEAWSEAGGGGEGQGQDDDDHEGGRCFLVCRGHQRTSLEQRVVHERDIAAY